jgi:hypothetical protein
MTKIFDELQFDDRCPDDLFIRDKSDEPIYADILKRWASGYRLSESEKIIAVRIMILYPRYIEYKNKAEDVIGLLRGCLLKTEMLNPLNPERGLVLYVLFFLFLKQGKNEEASDLLDLMKEYFYIYDVEIGSALTPQKSSIMDEYSKELRNHAFSIFPPEVEDAYTEILTLIMDSPEILSLKSGFNISQLPVPLSAKLPASQGKIYRSQALEYFYIEAYDKASVVYRELLINKFELPGTLAHLARLELISGNIVQAEIFITNAWRLRHEAPPYVLCRLLYIILFLKIAKLSPFDMWLGRLKHVLKQPDCIMQWDMDRVLEQYKKDTQPQHVGLLKTLLDVLSGLSEESNLNKFVVWQKAAPIPYNVWTDFDIVYYSPTF